MAYHKDAFLQLREYIDDTEDYINIQVIFFWKFSPVWL